MVLKNLEGRSICNVRIYEYATLAEIVNEVKLLRQVQELVFPSPSEHTVPISERTKQKAITMANTVFYLL